MKNMMIALILATGMIMTGCGSSNSEGDIKTDSTSVSMDTSAPKMDQNGVPTDTTMIQKDSTHKDTATR